MFNLFSFKITRCTITIIIKSVLQTRQINLKTDRRESVLTGIEAINLFQGESVKSLLMFFCIFCLFGFFFS